MILILRDIKAAKHFFMKALAAFLVSKSRMIKDDKNSDNPVAIQELKEEKGLSYQYGLSSYFPFLGQLAAKSVDAPSTPIRSYQLFSKQ
jgi:transposase-like protein